MYSKSDPIWNLLVHGPEVPVELLHQHLERFMIMMVLFGQLSKLWTSPLGSSQTSARFQVELAWREECQEEGGVWKGFDLPDSLVSSVAMTRSTQWRLVPEIALIVLVVVQEGWADPETVDGLLLTKKSQPGVIPVNFPNNLGWSPRIHEHVAINQYPPPAPLGHQSWATQFRVPPTPHSAPHQIRNGPFIPSHQIPPGEHESPPNVKKPNSIPNFPNQPVINWFKPMHANFPAPRPGVLGSHELEVKVWTATPQPRDIKPGEGLKSFSPTMAALTMHPHVSPATNPGASTAVPRAIPDGPRVEQDLNQLQQLKEETQTPSVLTAPKPPQAKKEMEQVQAPAPQIEPRSSYLKDARSEAAFEPFGMGSRTDAFTGGDRHKAILGLVIGIVFVTAFVAMGIGLAAQCVADRVKLMKDKSVLGRMRSPNGDDETPPELNGSVPFGSSPCDRSPSDARNGKMSNMNPPLFTGKLILHDPPGLSSSALCRTTAAAASKMTNTLFAAQQAVIMPSPAEQVTDDLISPKYDTDDCSENEDDSDDTVYECPGLAANATAMEEMVVKNPFYLQGGEIGLRPTLANSSDPQPISSQSSIFHHGIKGAN
eukprot:maker-scaffold1135_size60270-snap-gene-0.10 protein:Tk10820 transcript:maker-scaffold1135_size60270-snap-gene-0.10-mRNA-1 annotation:"neural proliferation differentiation and control protein 1 isoform x1"